MFELPEFGPLMAVVVPIVIVLLGVVTFWIVQRRKEKVIRSSDHGHEVPDDTEYPTVLGGGPDPGEPRNGSEEPPPGGRPGRDEGDSSGR